MKKRKEIAYINYMKCFGMIYLMSWHTGLRYINTLSIEFFLQMFVFISGYFYKDYYSKNLLLFYKKRISGLYLPFVFYCTSFLILNNFFVKCNIYPPEMALNFSKSIKLFYQILMLTYTPQLAGAMWFVSSLFIISIVFSLASRFSLLLWGKMGKLRHQEITRCLIVVTLYIIGIYYIRKKVPAMIDVSLVLLLFYYLGFLFREFEQIIPMNFPFFIISIALIIFLSRIGFIEFSQRQYIHPLFVVMCGIAGIYFNLYIAKKMPPNSSSKCITSIMSYIGKNSMAILALHLLSYKIISFFIIITHHLPPTKLSDFPTIKSVTQQLKILYITAGIFIPIGIKFIYESLRQRITFFAVR